jgi:hypothetical protein
MERVEHDITADLIRELLREQHPDLAGLPLALGARGWAYQLWRLGGDLAVRIPWAAGRAGELLRREEGCGLPRPGITGLRGRCVRPDQVLSAASWR